MSRHNIEGWAFTADEEGGKRRYRDRYEAIKGRRRELVEAMGPTVGAAHYWCRTSLDLSPEDLAILCDQGNVCFGAIVDIVGDSARVTIWTD